MSETWNGADLFLLRIVVDRRQGVKCENTYKVNPSLTSQPLPLPRESKIELGDTPMYSERRIHVPVRWKSILRSTVSALSS